MPLYTIWFSRTTREILFALFHCAAGDLLIAAVAVAAGLVMKRRRGAWPPRASVVIVVGLGYTVFSEWWNVSVVHSWAYSDLMPMLPWLGTGVSPLLQWVVVPAVALAGASRRLSRKT